MCYCHRPNEQNHPEVEDLETRPFPHYTKMRDILHGDLATRPRTSGVVGRPRLSGRAPIAQVTARSADNEPEPQASPRFGDEMGRPRPQKRGRPSDEDDAVTEEIRDGIMEVLQVLHAKHEREIDDPVKPAIESVIRHYSQSLTAEEMQGIWAAFEHPGAASVYLGLEEHPQQRDFWIHKRIKRD